MFKKLLLNKYIIDDNIADIIYFTFIIYFQNFNILKKQYGDFVILFIYCLTIII